VNLYGSAEGPAKVVLAFGRARDAVQIAEPVIGVQIFISQVVIGRAVEQIAARAALELDLPPGRVPVFDAVTAKNSLWFPTGALGGRPFRASP
jgi:peptidyl-tRNA hydrolase